MTEERLFSPRFFLMCGYSFLVFLSAFQLLPTAPFQILALGGTAAAAGLFLGGLTYASALTAPITGALADRIGKRRILMISSLAIAVFSAVYAVLPSYQLMLVVVVIHGVFWSGLLAASGAYVTDIVPATRRAEGVSYWGLATVFATSVAPTIGLWIFEHGGWWWLCMEAMGLNLAMFAVAYTLPPDVRRAHAAPFSLAPRTLIEWPVLILSFTLFLYSFGYGAITSFVAMYADANGVTPRALYFTVFSIAIVFTRPPVARLGDRIGHRKVLLPALALVCLGFALLAVGGTWYLLVASALVFGVGFGSAYPLFVAHVLRQVGDTRRGAAFGGILAMFDTGIGTGSILVGWIVEHHGFQAGYGAAAVLAAFAIPYFLLAEPRVLRFAARPAR